ncbi:uncharacterized protein BYT42DRAFT_592036 [Radiomyces spectabilis]|uniref:uncharacterized protein n=1 Tax=Radiomyces spectabilis TaxID=64574 RepID=UPI00221FAFE8|nr:uncharacterized protein BYT42DRAFT_592036 [Radiomyces spectabilis]KAI8391641.1 hypothetical protein BYT42DRAFT_592036 [Radiomyces spectabilis]
MVIYKSPFAPIPIPDVDLYSFIFQPNEINQSYPHDRKVVIHGITGQTLTFDDIHQRSRCLAAGWTNLGLGKDDIIAVFAPNQYDHVVLYLSILAAKCTVTPGNPAYTEAEFHHQIENSGAKALVTVPALLPVLLKVCAKVGIPRNRIFLFGDEELEGCKPFNSLAVDKPLTLPLQGINPKEDVAFVCYSSGTTGVAKGVMLTHQNFVAQLLQYTHNRQLASEARAGAEAEAQTEEKLPDDDVVLGFLPFYHIFGLTSLVLASCYTLTPVVIMPHYDLELLCQLIQKYKITMASIVPPVAVHLAKSAIVEKYDLSSLRLLGCGAAPLSKEHIESLAQRIPATLKQGYGMTETTSGVISQTEDSGSPGSIGQLYANTECKIVNEKGEELGDDEEGELVFRGPSIMKGYLNNPKANAETFLEGGWMRTGDVGKYCSATGEFYIMDRLKELIKYKGYQVAPAELEAVLMGRPDVADCCVVGVYDSTQATEIPRAYVVLQPTVQPTDKLSKDLADYVKTRVSNQKWLRGGVRFVSAIPKSASGKILRRQVKDWVKKEQQQEPARSRL